MNLNQFPMKLITKNVLSAIALAGILWSCSEAEDPSLGPEGFNGNDLTLTTQVDEVNGEMDDIVMLMAQVDLSAAKETGVSNRYAYPSCVQTTQTVTFPYVYRTMDFGTGCTWVNGRTYAGVLNAVLTLNTALQVTNVTLTSDSFKIDGLSFSGTKSAVIKVNEAGNRVAEVTTDLVITTSSGLSAMVTGTLKRERIAGADSNNWEDNVFLIEGNRTITTSKGRKFYLETESALRRELSCKYVVSGTLRMDLDIPASLWLDYGNGSCDNKGLLSDSNGNSWEVLLRK